MKRPDNTEMDRLLRRQARLGGGAVRGAAPHSGAHMDADEMNAYAEGALPEAARSRYFSHLADCDPCRKLVTELTLAAVASAEGRERAAAAQTAAPSKSWRERLAAILSPQVLRYSVPALALLAVVIVALVALRADRSGSSVARYETNTTSSAPQARTGANSAVQQSEPQSSENHASGNFDSSPTDDRPAATLPEAPGATDAPAPVERAPADRDATPAAEATPAPKTVAQFEEDKTSSRESEQPTGGRRAQEDVAAAPPPPPQPAQEPVLSAPSAAGETTMRDEDEQRKSKAGKDDTADTSTGTVANRAEQNRERRDAGKAEGGGPTSARAGAPMTRKRAPGGVVSENEASSDTQSVGGRKFRRQDGAWVDTAYNPSGPTTNVRRGSEQYRTLVADEPGLRQITNQLGGEVIVVWKTRAYRFY